MPDSFTFTGPIVWRPTPDYVERAHLTRFMRLHGIGSFNELMQKSTSDVAWFTDAIFKYLDIRFDRPYSRVVDLSRGIAWPEWCVGGKLNIATNCLDKYRMAQTSRVSENREVWDQRALISESQKTQNHTH